MYRVIATNDERTASALFSNERAALQAFNAVSHVCDLVVIVRVAEEVNA